MRKPYEKPTLTALSLVGNEALCGSCLPDGYNPTGAEFTSGVSCIIEVDSVFGSGLTS